MPVVAIDQLNRGPSPSGQRPAAVSDLRESGSIQMGEDVVFTVRNPDAYGEEDRQAR